jgi:hypothetical protein
MKCDPRRWTSLGKRLKIFVKRKDQLRSFEVPCVASNAGSFGQQDPAPGELTPTNEKDLPLIIHISTHLGRDVMTR